MEHKSALGSESNLVHWSTAITTKTKNEKENIFQNENKKKYLVDICATL